jgi:FKBP-type peptidyl-prolyl cis-trans isomerase FklB
MKRFMVFALSMLLFIGFAQAEEKKVLQSQKDKVSYSIGVNVGSNLKMQSVDVDPDIVAQGIKDALSGSKLLMTEKEVAETLMNLQKDLIAKQAEERKKAAEKNRLEGENFLAENKKKEGVVTLPSGLQYKIIKEGTGKTPKLTDTVVVNYRGTLISGKEFDSSYKRGEPSTFPVNAVIPGWTEALQLMKEGSVWQLFIPSNLAYGERGAGNVIGPNEVLIFEVELISVK